ncbi:hypothetical protein E2C01_085027 [Portunus trituberculatus]|uniref:Uncharacterized protein n=1 Tax=Portunus trituberculatus TaxID=210409 RepID=A0A5B7IWV7_PORTR|nr:hypothetical protein [Portunus trituberculatus]
MPPSVAAWRRESPGSRRGSRQRPPVCEAAGGGVGFSWQQQAERVPLTVPAAHNVHGGRREAAQLFVR